MHIHDQQCCFFDEGDRDRVKNSKVSYNTFSQAIRLQAAMCEWYPMLTTSDSVTTQDSHCMDNIQDQICSIHDMYQCLGCGYLANNRNDLTAHCAAAVSGKYNGYKAHTESPAVDGLMSQAHIIIKKIDVLEESNIETILASRDVQHAKCNSSRVKRVNFISPSYSTVPEFEAICKALHTVIHQIVHQNTNNPSPPAVRVYVSTDSQASIDIIKGAQSITARKMVRSPHKDGLSVYRPLSAVAAANNITISFRHQKAYHDLMDEDEKSKPLAQLNDICDRNAKMQAQGGRLNEEVFLGYSDNTKSLQFSLQLQGLHVGEDYFKILSRRYRMQCLHAATRNMSQKSHFQDILWSSEKICKRAQALVFKQLPQHMKTRIYQFLLDIKSSKLQELQGLYMQMTQSVTPKGLNRGENNVCPLCGSKDGWSINHVLGTSSNYRQPTLGVSTSVVSAYHYENGETTSVRKY